MDLLFGIEANFILDNSIEVIMKRIKNYIKVGLSANKNFTLYFNDIPANISTDKLQNIFNEIRNIKDTFKSNMNF
jgi:sRNA-binding carbon storage regulator CsrA